MNGRMRVQSALQHRSGELPVDFGATAVTGMHVRIVSRLRDYFGLASCQVKVCEPYQMLGAIEDDLMDALGIDVVGLPAPNTIFGFRNENWRPYRLPWGQEALVSEHFQTTQTPDGGLLLYPQGDRHAPPSGHMPAGGYFFDTIVRQPPLDESTLNPEDNLEEFGPISEEDLDYFRGEAKRLHAGERAVIANFGGTAFGDIALVPAPFLPHPKGIRDVAEWYVSTVTRQDYIHKVFDRQCELAIANLTRIRQAVGDVVDAVFVCGTDFGTQTSQFCSVDTYRSLYAPYYRRINDWVHAHTTWKTFKHSCGAIRPFVEPFIESGFDIVNPVQCSAAGMAPQALKDEFGDRIVFWGGGVDTQHVLPFGTPAEVRAQVLDRCRIFARGGGFVFNAIHNVQATTPVENAAAMFEAVRAFRKSGG